MTEASVVAVGTPQSFRQQIARALEVEMEEIGWAQSATVAEELLINAFTPIDVPGSTSSPVFGINDAGQMVGWYSALGSTLHGFLYSGGVFTTHLCRGHQ